MATVFKLWVVNLLQKSEPDVMLALLKLLKFQPEVVKAIFTVNLGAWATLYAAETGENPILYNRPDKIEEIMEALKGRFANELEIITE